MDFMHRRKQSGFQNQRAWPAKFGPFQPSSNATIVLAVTSESSEESNKVVSPWMQPLIAWEMVETPHQTKSAGRALALTVTDNLLFKVASK